MNTCQYFNTEDVGVYDNKLLTEIHPTAKIGKNVTFGKHVTIEENVVIGDDCFIGHYCHIRPGSIIGDRVSMRSFCLLDPEVKLGNDIAIYPHATVGGGTIVEDKVYWGPYSLTTNCDDIRHHRLPVDKEVIKPPVIREGAIIAAGCMIKPDVTIGRNSVLGLGSVLTKSIPDNQLWFGNPARYFREIPNFDRLAIDMEEEFLGFPDSILDYHENMGGV